MPNQASGRILIIEDEQKVAEALRRGLTQEGYEVQVCGSGEDGFFLAQTASFDLVLLDLMLPVRSGMEILQALRKLGTGVPVLIITAKDTLEDRIIGLDAGADDYLVKPFAFPELSARIRALLRRNKIDLTSKLVVQDLELDLLKRKVKRSHQAIDLTVREFELLEYLMKNKGRLVSREMLARDVWKESQRATPLDNVIDVHITRLRKKVDHSSFEVKLIQTVRGVGFRMSGEPE